MSVAHDEQGWKPEVCFTWQIMISIRQINTFHAILVFRLDLRSESNTFRDINFELLQQGFIVLQVTYPSMKAKDTHEDIFVV